MKLPAAMMAVALMAAGCGGGDSPETAREWLTKNGYKMDVSSISAAMKEMNGQAIKYFIAAERASPRITAQAFGYSLALCETPNGSHWFDTGTCPAVAKLFLDGGMPIGFRYEGHTLEERIKGLLGERDLNPRRKPAMLMLLKFVESQKK